jgi:CVNH domain
MKIVLGLFAGAILVIASTAALAQEAPPGSYRESCRDIRMQGPILTALCRRAHRNGEELTALNIAHCVGDIGNNSGNLVCNGGEPARPVPPPSQAQYAPGAPYPAPGYAPPPGQGQGYWERCEHLRHEERELRERLAYVPYGEERERLQYRLGQVHSEREQCPRR